MKKNAFYLSLLLAACPSLAIGAGGSYDVFAYCYHKYSPPAAKTMAENIANICSSNQYACGTVISSYTGCQLSSDSIPSSGVNLVGSFAAYDVVESEGFYMVVSKRN